MIFDHLASRWDRSPESLREDIDRSVQQGAHVITVTEVADGKRFKALRRKGWTTCQDRSPWQAGEVAALVRNDWAEVLHWETVQIAPDLGPGLPVVVIIVVVRLHGTGKTVMVAESHMPSAVEGAWRVRRGAAFRSAARNYRTECARVRKAWDPDAEVLWADWNLNLNLGWVAAWAKDFWKGRARLLGRKKLPSKGTHGNRLIDWPLTRGLRKRGLTVLAKTEGSDHRAVRLTARFR